MAFYDGLAAAWTVPPRLIVRSLRYWVGSRRVRLADRLAERRTPSGPPRVENRALAAGLFSFPTHGATAGDLIACEVVCRWLAEAGMQYDVAFAPPFTGGRDWRDLDPRDYSHVVWICGPLGETTEAFARLRRRFPSGGRWIGINLSMMAPVDEWNPFLLERDSSRAERADLAFADGRNGVPVVGLVQVESFTPLFPDRDRQERARRDSAARVFAPGCRRGDRHAPGRRQRLRPSNAGRDRDSDRTNGRCRDDTPARSRTCAEERCPGRGCRSSRRR